jgi:hypothetical protein
MCRQLAAHASGDVSNFDITRLVYAMLTYHAAVKSVQPGKEEQAFEKDSFGFEKDTGASSFRFAPRSKSFRYTWYGNLRLNHKIVSEALHVIFQEQQKNGLWRRGQAIKGDDPRRDIGNSYVFAFDMIGSMLEEFESTPEMIQGYLPNLCQALTWAEDNYMLFKRQGELISGWRCSSRSRRSASSLR